MPKGHYKRNPRPPKKNLKIHTYYVETSNGSAVVIKAESIHEAKERVQHTIESNELKDSLGNTLYITAIKKL